MVMKKNYIEFEQVVERGCGMDVHKEIIVVTIQGKGIKTMTKSFHAFTSSLIKLKKWLKNMVLPILLWKVPGSIGNLFLMFLEMISRFY
jgi:hypothetical protein